MGLCEWRQEHFPVLYVHVFINYRAYLYELPDVGEYFVFLYYIFLYEWDLPLHYFLQLFLTVFVFNPDCHILYLVL